MLNFIYVVVVSVFVTGINLSAIFTASEPSSRQTIASAVFLVFWLLFAIYKGLNRDKAFVKFSLIYWIVGLALSFAGAIEGLRFMAVVSVFIFIGPSYGLLYYVTDGFILAQYILYAIGIPLLLAIVGYYIGIIIGIVETVQAQKGKS